MEKCPPKQDYKLSYEFFITIYKRKQHLPGLCSPPNVSLNVPVNGGDAVSIRTTSTVG
jgi:hypothetical protein